MAKHDTMSTTGKINVQTENIFPIIKKFLYSDNEIFLRELVSNAVDATQKLKALNSMGEATGDLGDTKIEIEVDKKSKTITIKDKGIGMTKDEIEKYITQIAFSGAEEFVNKYKDKVDKNVVIGHFGLGFYSAFMVAKKVEIFSLSYKKDAKADEKKKSGKKSKRRSKKNDEDIMYDNFVKTKKPRVKKSHPEFDSKEIISYIKQKWEKLPDEKKLKYKNKKEKITLI